MATKQCDLLVIGAGPGGYTAAFRASDLGVNTILVDENEVPGGVCLRVGCIPSKAYLHIAAHITEAAELAKHGVSYGSPQIDKLKLRQFKDSVVQRLTGGLKGMAKQRGCEFISDYAEFASPNSVMLKKSGDTIEFRHCIIAAGSRILRLPFLEIGSEKVLDSTTALEIEEIPDSLLVIGGGYIGLELGSVYAALGSRVDVVELQDHILSGADRDAVRPLEKRLKGQFGRIMLSTKVTGIKDTGKAVRVDFDGNEGAFTGEYGRVLVSIGRRSNSDMLAIEKAGVAVGDGGFINIDKQMRTNVPHIFAIGDIAGQPMLAHKASHEGRVAAEVIAGHHSIWDKRCIPAVVFTDPELAWAGLTEEEAKEQGIDYGVGKFPWAASGKAIALDRMEGLTKMIFDNATGRILGCSIVGVGAGDLIAEAALAIEMGAHAEDIAETIHAHPTLAESVGFAAEVFLGTVTDMYVPKRSAASSRDSAV
ncbi:MAG: dihydrolipoyl dehydrogenase [bacterium]